MVENKELQSSAASPSLSPPSQGGLGGVERGVSPDLLLQAYYWMRLTRAFDEFCGPGEKSS